MDTIENPYTALLSFAYSMKVEYSHRFGYYKESRWSEFRVKSVGGCAGTTQFREKVSGIILSCQSVARDTLRSVEQSHRVRLLSEWKEAVHDLKYLSSEDKIEYDESEYGPTSVEHFTCLPIDNREGDLYEPVHPSTWKKLAKATEHYALEWVSLIADAESGIMFLQNSESFSIESSHGRPFVARSVIESLSGVRSDLYDVSRLVAMCKELNRAYEAECPISVAVLTRAIIDHVPPIFGKSSFSDVANQHRGRSLKLAFMNLDKAVRNLSDGLLHQHIRSRETLPKMDQMRFETDLEQLLMEIVRCLA